MLKAPICCMYYVIKYEDNAFWHYHIRKAPRLIGKTRCVRMKWLYKFGPRRKSNHGKIMTFLVEREVWIMKLYLRSCKEVQRLVSCLNEVDQDILKQPVSGLKPWSYCHRWLSRTRADKTARDYCVNNPSRIGTSSGFTVLYRTNTSGSSPTGSVRTVTV